MNDSAYDAIEEILITDCGIDRDLIDPSAKLIDDLGMDSLDIETLFDAMSRDFHVGFSGINKRCIVTVRDLVDLFY